jgi:hypothetical protein
MKQMSRYSAPAAAAALLLAFGLPAQTHAQVAPPADFGGARLGVSTGVFTPRDAAVASADGRDTRFGAGPSFGLDLQFGVASIVAVYGSGTAAFSTLARGSEIQVGATGPSDQMMVAAVTGGAMFGYFGLHPHIVPTLRLGGGIKAYSFDLAGAESHVRPTGDIGIGMRGGSGVFDVGAEIRYLPSTFDQARLPTRGIVPQEQRQTDLLLSLSIGLRL